MRDTVMPKSGSASGACEAAQRVDLFEQQGEGGFELAHLSGAEVAGVSGFD